MKLYHCKGAPNPRRVSIFLAEKGIEIPRIEISIVKGENLQPEFLTVNPRGLLPVLELDDGTRIDETVAICRYFEELHPDPPLMGTDALSEALVECWQRHVELDGLSAAAEVFRNSHPAFATRGVPGTSGVKAIPELVERGAASLGRFYDRLDQRLAQSEFIAGDRFSIADITALCTIDFAAAVKHGIPAEDAHTQRWYAAVSARPSAST